MSEPRKIHQAEYDAKEAKRILDLHRSYGIGAVAARTGKTARAASNLVMFLKDKFPELRT